MFCCPHCSIVSTILNNIVEPELGVRMRNNIDNRGQPERVGIVWWLNRVLPQCIMLRTFV